MRCKKLFCTSADTAAGSVLHPLYYLYWLPTLAFFFVIRMFEERGEDDDGSTGRNSIKEHGRLLRGIMVLSRNGFGPELPACSSLGCTFEGI